MAFPRQFSNQVWYLRIPSGEIEIATSEALKSAYKCGLVDLRTPVRAFGAHAWQTMQEAAEIELPTTPSMVSLSPVALSHPPPELEEAMTRQSRVDIDPRAFKPSRRPAVFTALGVAACLLAFGLGKGGLVKNARVAAATAALEAADDEAPRVKPMTVTAKRSPEPMREMLHSSERYDGQRFSKDQKWKLQELDYITRTQRPKSAKLTTMTQRPLPGAPGTKSEDPFSHSGAKGDPLDGTL